MDEPRVDERPDRRQLLLGLGRGALRVGLAGGAVAAAGALFRRAALPRPVEQAATGILRPPGALAAEHDFLAACVRCNLCAQACDTGCIRLLGPFEGRHAGTPWILAEERATDIPVTGVF